MIYVGRNFTATATGSRVVDVQCEQCRKPFHYELIRQGKGTGTAPYMIGQESAKQRAHDAAQRDMVRRLKKESEMVACPSCHWVNRELVAGYRRTRFRRVPMLGIILAVVVGFVFLFMGMEANRHRDETDFTPYLMAGGGALAVAVAGFVIQWALRRTIDPNRAFPQPPKLPVGTPQGWTDEEAIKLAQTRPGEAPGLAHRPFDAAAADADHVAGWVMIRAGEFFLPAVCCECLSPRVVSAFKAPVSVNGNDNPLSPPLCKECLSRLKSTWWTGALATCGAVGIVAALAYCMLQTDIGGKVMVAVLILIFGGVIGVAAVPGRMTRSYGFKVVDAARALYRVRFRNEQYTEMIRQSVKEVQEARKATTVPAAPLQPVLPPRPAR